MNASPACRKRCLRLLQAKTYSTNPRASSEATINAQTQPENAPNRAPEFSDRWALSSPGMSTRDSSAPRLLNAAFFEARSAQRQPAVMTQSPSWDPTLRIAESGGSVRPAAGFSSGPAVGVMGLAGQPTYGARPCSYSRAYSMQYLAQGFARRRATDIGLCVARQTP